MQIALRRVHFKQIKRLCFFIGYIDNQQKSLKDVKRDHECGMPNIPFFMFLKRKLTLNCFTHKLVFVR